MPTTVPDSPTPIEHYENFPVASWLCPRALRPPIAAIYHFARTADDLADEGTADAPTRLADLAAYRQALVQSCQDRNADPTPSDARWAHIFGPLRKAVHSFGLPPQLLHDLLDAFVQDIEKTRDGAGYANEADLLHYCRLSANPVGRLLLHLYGITDPQALQESDAICTALQLINFWQDLSVDIPRGRFYLPANHMARYGILQDDLLTQRNTSASIQLVAHCVQAAKAKMHQGAALVHRIPGRAGWELRLVVQGGLRIVDKIEAMGYTTLNNRPTLRWWDLPVMLWRAAWM